MQKTDYPSTAFLLSSNIVDFHTIKN